jgi:hypothetical protein
MSHGQTLGPLLKLFWRQNDVGPCGIAVGMINTENTLKYGFFNRMLQFI